MLALKERLGAFTQNLLKEWVVDSFHRRWYHSSDSWQQNSYFGFGIKQLPLDLWIYQELIYRLKPPFIVQTGVSEGGSMLFFAHLFDLLQAPPSAVIVGIDIKMTDSAKRLDHPRLRLIEASSTELATIERVKALLPAGEGFVSLDSDHSKDHVRREMDLYAAFVAKGSYMVVEDTNVNGHPVHPDHGAGPYEAVQDFLSQNQAFERDDSVWKRNLFSFHQYGWLKRVR